MTDESDFADFVQRRLSDDQRAMLALLGNPEIIGGSGTGRYFISDPAAAEMPFLKPPYTITYYCPVVTVLGRPRQVMANGDLVEIDPERMGPVEALWST